MPFVAFGLFYNTHNNLVALDLRCDQALSHIDIQLKRRHELIPKIVETVRCSTRHEDQVLLAVVDARRSALIASIPDIKLQAETEIDLNLRQFILSVEHYPDLAANEEFKGLRGELLDCENTITVARRYVNFAIREYNTVLGQFPERKVAPMFRLRTRRFLDLSAERVLFEAAPIISPS